MEMNLSGEFAIKSNQENRQNCLSVNYGETRESKSKIKSNYCVRIKSEMQHFPFRHLLFFHTHAHGVGIAYVDWGGYCYCCCGSCSYQIAFVLGQDKE